MKPINIVRIEKKTLTGKVLASTAYVSTLVVLGLALSHISGASLFSQQEPEHVKSFQSNGDSEVAGSVVVTNKPNDIVNYAKGQGLEPSEVIKRGQGKPSFVSLEETPDHPRVRALAKQKNVTVAPDYVYGSFFAPNDPKYAEQWNLSKISAPKAWNIERGSSGTTIAVIDTGVLLEQVIGGTTYSQPDFPTSSQWENPGETGTTEVGDPCWTGTPEAKKSNSCDDDENGKIDDWRGWDFMGGFRGNNNGCPNHSDATTYENPSDPTFIMQDKNPQPYSCDSPTSPSTLNKNHYDGRCIAWESACFVGHGTMVGSVISAATDNSKLIAGVDHNAKLMNIRVLDGYGYGTTARIAAGIEYAASKGADVINLSLGSNCNNESFTDSIMENAIQAAKTAGVVIVAASGNDGADTICYPASSPDVMAIGASDENDKRIGYSSYSKNNKLDVVAPSEVPVANAPSGFINSNYYGGAGGTSLSTPHVAGLAGLIRAAEPDSTRNEIRDIIRSGARKVAEMDGKNFHAEYGYGRISLYHSLWEAIGANTHKPYTWSVVSNKAYGDEAMTQQFTSKITVPPGESIFIRLKVRNDGYLTWDNSFVRLATANPNGRTSVFQDDSWLFSGRPTNLVEATVEPDEIGTFEFVLKAPDQTGSHKEYFGGVAEGRKWFSNSSVAYSINVVEPSAARFSLSKATLQPGQQLKPDEYLISQDGQTTLILRGNGNLILRTHFKSVWSTGTSGTSSRLVMQGDGNLVLYASGGSVLWHTETHGNNGARLVAQTDGNLVIYDTGDNILWSTDTEHYPDNLGMVNNVARSVFTLLPGQRLETANRKLRLVLQGDGNLVLYASGKGAVWASGTSGKLARRLVLQSDGNLVLYRKGGVLWHSHTARKGKAVIKMQSDGNVVVYNGSGKPIWHTATHNK